MTREEYLKMAKQIGNEENLPNTGSFLDQHFKDSAREISSSEEKASLLVQVFGKTTSVIYDTKTVCDLIQLESIPQS